MYAHACAYICTRCLSAAVFDTFSLSRGQRLNVTHISALVQDSAKFVSRSVPREASCTFEQGFRLCRQEMAATAPVAMAMMMQSACLPLVPAVYRQPAVGVSYEPQLTKLKRAASRALRARSVQSHAHEGGFDMGSQS